MNNVIEKKSRIDEILDEGIDSHEYTDIILSTALVGSETNVMTELDHSNSLILAAIDAIIDPRKPDGSIDEIVAYDCSVMRAFVHNYKLNMISNKRKGRMEIVKVMQQNEDEEEGMTGRLKAAIKGED